MQNAGLLRERLLLLNYRTHVPRPLLSSRPLATSRALPRNRPPCPLFSTHLGALFKLEFQTSYSSVTLIRRKDSRAPRAPKRSPTPTSAAYPDGSNLSPVPSSPGAAVQKPLYLCSPFSEAALVKGNFKTIVMLPKYVDVMEWVAVNSKKPLDYPTRKEQTFSSFRLLHESQLVLRCHS